MGLIKHLPLWLKVPLAIAAGLVFLVVASWVIAIAVPLYVLKVFVDASKNPNRLEETKAKREIVVLKIRALLAAYGMEDTYANRSRLMQLRWAYPKSVVVRSPRRSSSR